MAVASTWTLSQRRHELEVVGQRGSKFRLARAEAEAAADRSPLLELRKKGPYLRNLLSNKFVWVDARMLKTLPRCVVYLSTFNGSDHLVTESLMLPSVACAK